MLAAAGAGNETQGFFRVFIVFTVLSVIATIIAFALKDTMIGKK